MLELNRRMWYRTYVPISIPSSIIRHSIARARKAPWLPFINSSKEHPARRRIPRVAAALQGESAETGPGGAKRRPGKARRSGEPNPAAAGPGGPEAAQRRGTGRSTARAHQAPPGGGARNKTARRAHHRKSKPGGTRPRSSRARARARGQGRAAPPKAGRRSLAAWHGAG